MPVRPSVHPYVRPQKVSSISVEVDEWCDSMQYDLIQGQGHELFKVWISAIFEGYLLGKWPRILKLGGNI